MAVTETIMTKHVRVIRSTFRMDLPEHITQNRVEYLESEIREVFGPDEIESVCFLMDDDSPYFYIVIPFLKDENPEFTLIELEEFINPEFASKGEQL